MLLQSLVTCVLPTVAFGAGTYTLNVPLHAPSSISRRLSPALTSLSVDPAFWVEFWGNETHPNAFSLKMIQNIADRTGSYPIIRPGGVSQDSSIFNESFTAQLTRTTAENGTIWRTTYGPSFYRSFSNFPKGVKLTVPLNFGNDSLEIALEQAKGAVKYVQGWKDRLWGVELGNESGNYKATQRDLTTWGPAAYVAEWKNWTSIINSHLPAPLRTKWWAGSDGITPDLITVALQTEDIIARGIDDPPIISEFSQHMYAYSSCRPASNARAIIPNIHNHTNITAFVGLIHSKWVAANAIGSDFIVGEFNSVSCSGKPNVTDIFGQALWVIDTTLYSASMNASRVHLHQGATLVSQSDEQLNIPGVNGTPGFSTYDLWYPVDTPLRGVKRGLPSYTSQLFIAETVGKSGTARITHLDAPDGIDPDHFAAYAVYDEVQTSTRRGRTLAPARLAIINWNVYNITTGTPDNYITLDISSLLRAKSRSLASRSSAHSYSPTLKRLTAPGHDETNADYVTWAGQAWTNGTGVPHGKESVEVVRDGKVRVRGSEAVLVFL